MADCLADMKKYDSGFKEEMLTKIVKRLGIAFRNDDSSLVSCSNPKELDHVKARWIAKKLGTDEAKKANGGLRKVCKVLSAGNTKNHVTSYYLAATEIVKLGKL